MRSLVERFYERLWNAWDDVAVDQTLSESFSFRGSLGQQTVGRDEWRAYRDEVRRSSPDFTNQVVELLTNGDRAAARLHYSGTHGGRLLGVPGTGRRFSYDGAAFFRAESGLLVQAWVLGDLESLQRQLAERT